MKKTLLLLATAALLLVGCAKEQLSNGLEGELTKVTFTASLDSGVTTKAVADGDGVAANVNRCIMEIYYGDDLFTRQITKVTDKKATFTVQVVSNRTYTVAFWADKVDNLEDLATDKYYITNAEGGLQAIAIKSQYIGNDDARDAFFHVGNYTVAQAGSSFGSGEEDKILLKRPFAQMNVITTDWDKAASVTGLAPKKVNVTIKNALVNFNAVTGVASGSQNLNYEAAVYTAPARLTTAPADEKTLSMDYLFASADKAVIDIDWKALHGTDANVEHAFAAVPYQRNYRTNIKGALLTTQGQWNVTVEPIWELDPNGDFDYAYTSVCDIKGANDFVAQNKDKKEISVTFSTQPNDAGDPSEGTDEHPINAIVTSLLKEGATYNIDVASTTDVLYVGDYDYTTTTTGTTYDYTVVLEETSEKTKAAAVNLVVTDNLYIGTLVVNSPSKSVSINGQTVQSGKTYHIENLQVQEVSMNTVIIESGMVVDNLEMIKGGLEIHGTVNKATVPDNHGEIAVRDCENLDEELVYNVLKNYIAEGYVGVKGRTTAGKWDIIPWICKIENTGYGTLADAVAAVQSGETITLVRDYEGDGVVVEGGKNFTLDFGGYTYKVIGNLAGSAGTQNQCFQLLKGSTLTFQNGTITTSCAKLGINTYSNLTIKDVTIDMSQTEATGQVACLETCNGTVSVEGASNLIAKEGQIATLVLYWPNGVYGDINLTMNTTGEVSGLMAYGSYQVQDLSTVAQHSHVAIKNGKYDVTFDMDGLESYDYVISGGVFSEKPDASLIAEHFDAVANTDPATSAKYPYTVKVKPVVKIGNVEYADIADAFAAVPANTPTTVTLLENIGSKEGDEINWKEYDKTSVYKIKDGQNITFDLNGHKIYAKTTVTGYTCFFEVVNGGSLTFMDSAGGGELHYLDGMDDTGGLAIISYGTLIMQSGTVENHTKCNSSAIQGAIDVRANEWGAQYQYHSVFTMNGGVLKSNGDNTLRIYDSSQTGTGSVVVDFEINDGEIYGADAVFIMPSWTKDYSTGEKYMNQINVSVKGGSFDTTNGIRVYGIVNDDEKSYKAIKINVSGGVFKIHENQKHRVNYVAFQNSENRKSTQEDTQYLVSYTEVNWTAAAPTYSAPVSE